MDTFQTLEMVAALEQILPQKSFFLDTFFKTTEEHATESIEIDLVNHNRRMAQFALPTDKAFVLDRKGYTNSQFKIPTIREKMPYEASQFMNRLPGETIYSGGTPNDRILAQLGKDLDYMRSRVLRRMEWMAMKGLMTGKVPIKNVGGTIDAEIDFKMKSSHKITNTTTANWDDAAGVPLTQFRTWRRLIQQDSGKNPNICIMAPDTVDLFFNNAQVKNYINNSLSRMVRGEINSNIAQAADGATFLGRVEGIDIYEYVEFFDDDQNSNTTTQLMPQYGLLFGSTDIDCRRHFGVIQDVEAGVNAVGQWYPKEWIEKDPSILWRSLHSSPLPAVHQVDGVVNVIVKS